MSSLRRLLREALPITLVLLAGVVLCGLTAWTVTRWPLGIERAKPIIEIAAGLATIAAAGVAIWALAAWRKEHVGRQKIDLASETLVIILGILGAEERNG